MERDVTFTDRARPLDTAAVVAALPAFREVRQSFGVQISVDVSATLLAELDAPRIRDRVRSGDRVAVAVGSRGISSLAPLVATLISWLKARGARPFIVPAMGSHGSATALGQQAVLAHLGIDEEATGAPVDPDMTTQQIGNVIGPGGFEIPVFTAQAAITADHVVPVGRIKPHTDFRGSAESGLRKMLAIGLGKLDGARSLHQVPPEHFSALIQDASALVLGRLHVPFGVAIVEAPDEQVGIVEVVASEDMAVREPQLLDVARGWLPRLPAEEVDVLVVAEIGKDMSGTGMDTNVTGRFYTEPTQGLRAQRIVVLDLSKGSLGNACGVGMADVVTARLARRVDWYSTYANEVAARLVQGCRLPLVALDDEEALAIAVSTLSLRSPQDARIALIRNTRDLETFAVSEPLWREIQGNPSLTSSTPSSLRFEGGVMSL